MKYLIFSELNRNHFFFLSYLIIIIIKEINNLFITKIDDIIQTFNKYYIYSLSDLFSIIPFIIIKVRSKSVSKNTLSNEIIENKNKIRENSKEKLEENNEDTKLDLSNSIELLHLDLSYEAHKRRLKRILKYTILISILDFIALYINAIFNVIVVSRNFIITKEKLNSFILFNIISKYLFTILILHSPVYRHHYLCMAINLIFLIGLVVFDIINIENKEKKSYFYVGMKVISVVIFSLEDTYAKVLLSFDSISPYIYLLFRGIFVNSLALLFCLVFIFVELPDENGIKSCVYLRFWKVYEYKLNIISYISMFFIQYFQNLNILFIIDKFSPIHFAVASIIENICSLLFSIKSGFVLNEFIIKIVIYFILFLVGLIYVEFVVLNFCGLQKNTKLFLEKQAKDDIVQIMSNNIDNESNPENEMLIVEDYSTDEKKEPDIYGSTNTEIY